MKQARSEMVINVLGRDFPRALDSKLNKLVMKLQRKWGIDERMPQSTFTHRGTRPQPNMVLAVRLK